MLRVFLGCSRHGALIPGAEVAHWAFVQGWPAACVPEGRGRTLPIGREVGEVV
uniref:Uncharacterized protein n=1 Tax=Caldiarchaeum subterraneum TaxID=311458 RepID=E6N399_CALS0|nr:hypothetical protein HGMM_F29E04C11 [Candidatus Caldarchaeum subterraneum]